jgi:uncharacterized protein YkwD
MVMLAVLPCSRATEYVRLSAAQFARLPELAAPLDPATLDRALLARAIFHESNRVRQQLGLPRFKPSAPADAAAEMQALMGVLRGQPGHDNPRPELAHPADRIRRAGIEPEFSAENIARSPMLQVGPSGEWGVIKREGRRVFVDPPTGEELPWHTYASFARDLVRRWMDSPRHRANLTSPQLELLGCAVGPVRDVLGADMIVSIQVFATPEKSIRNP